MVPMHAEKKRKEALHEPQGRAGCPQPAEPRRGEDTAPYQLAWFMVPMMACVSGTGVSPVCRFRFARAGRPCHYRDRRRVGNLKNVDAKPSCAEGPNPLNLPA